VGFGIIEDGEEDWECSWEIHNEMRIERVYAGNLFGGLVDKDLGIAVKFDIY